MSIGKSARQYANIDSHEQNSTISLFVKNHTNPEQLYRQILGMYNAGSLEEASHVIECIIDTYNPLINSPELFVLQAKISIEQRGICVLTQCALQQALLIEPEHEEALQLQHLCLLHEELRDGLYEKGEMGLRAFLENELHHPYAEYLLANHLFWKNGPEKEALTLLERCVKMRPSFLKAWLCLAMAYKKGQQFVKSEAAFLECLSLDANSTNKEFYKRNLQSL